MGRWSRDTRDHQDRVAKRLVRYSMYWKNQEVAQEGRQMKKIVAIGMFFLAISMVIGVTWVGPVARSHTAAAAAPCAEHRRVPNRHRERHDGERRPDRGGNGAGDRAGREVSRLDVQRHDAGAGDPRPPRRHDPLHAHEREHDRHAALDRLPRGDDPVGRPPGRRIDDPHGQLPAGEPGGDQDVRLGGHVPRRLHVSLRRAAGPAAHLQRDVRRDHRRAREPAGRARIRPGLERVLPWREADQRCVRGRSRPDARGRPGVRRVQRRGQPVPRRRRSRSVPTSRSASGS